MSFRADRKEIPLRFLVIGVVGSMPASFNALVSIWISMPW